MDTSQKRIIHIGYAKAGSSFLQKHVFPKACALSNFKFANADTDLDELAYYHCQKLIYGLDVIKQNIPDRVMFSSESFCSWDPHYWEEYADKNLIAFGKESHTILVIREPKALLSSIYVQVCLHEFGGVAEPRYFFLDKFSYAERLPSAKFAIDEFSCKRLIDIYKSRFDNVSVVKYENISNLVFLKRVLNISDEQLKILQNNTSKKIINKSFSVLSVKIVFMISNLLNYFHLSIKKKDSNKVIDMLRINSLKQQNSNNILKKIINRILLEFNLRNFLQGRLDKVILYYKYKVNFSNFHQIDFLSKEYADLQNEATYINGKLEL
jgi:hypothetical protein